KFDQLTVHDEDHSGGTVGARGQDTVYQVRWQLRSPDSGAWLPTFVWVGVDLETGQVTRYFARRTDYRGPTAPKIDREQAVQIALAEAHKDPDLAHAIAGQVELSAGSVSGQDGVTWNVSLDNVPTHSLVRHFSVDAITGEILNPLGSPVG
ncbi:MAG TPA: PepSY domain-containing protein, partial [Nitrolancea sp.]|nr:PepSY domain-containing protein [Nitrolancea sp.]